MRYIIIKREIVERLWEIETETYNEAVDELKKIQEDNDSVQGGEYSSHLLKDTYGWRVYQEIDMKSNAKKYKMVEK